MSKTFTKEEVARHNTENYCWIIIDGKVYDVTKFLSAHPGGKKVILNEGGKDSTAKFNMFHNSAKVLGKYGPSLYIGDVAAAAAPADEKKKKKKQPLFTLPPNPNTFGEQTPYCEPAWYAGWNTAYYKESHRNFRAAIRAFVDKEIIPFVDDWDEAKAIPRDIYHKAAAAGWLPGCVSPPWPTEFAGERIAGGVKPEEYDAFHSLILIDELSRAGSGGVCWAIFAGLGIGLPAILHFGSDELKAKVAPGCLKGEKMICLAVTEPSGGSDVANIQTTARKTPDGKFYIVNGEKKWITNGVWADFFTTAVRTGGPGFGGISPS